MKKFYPAAILVITAILALMLPKPTYSQPCSSLTATYTVLESRCAATGSIKITASGGSGNYQYKVTGPVNTSYTSSTTITGLSSGNYLVTILDISTNCLLNKDTVTVPGSYQTPTFTMTSTGISCPNGKTGTITVTSQSYGLGPFSYKIIAPSPSKVGAVSVTGGFIGLTAGTYLIQLRDSCGAIQTRSIVVDDYDWFINNTTVLKNGCDSLNITINLKDIFNNTTPNSIFNGYKYGATSIPGDTTWSSNNTFSFYLGGQRSATLLVKDKCGNIKSVVWNNAAIPNANPIVAISNQNCATFTAAITGQINLTSPNYCLYDNSNVLISCSASPIFSNIPYGSYCIKITDNCYDTTFSRCFTASKPIPAVGSTVKTKIDCYLFSVSVTGQSNLTNPNYCLYDSSNALISCNTTGNFTNLNYGAYNTYCIKITNDPACYDTTITRCFNAPKPVPSVNAIVNTVTNCSSFSASITGQVNITNGYYCLYDSTNVLIRCDSTGTFDSLAYGSYCIRIMNDPSCYDTTIIRCFNVYKQIPGLGNTVNTKNYTCTTFDANTTGASNLTNPQYCLYDATNVLISCNTTGVFNGLLYGSYCIKTINDPTCYDTTITRCFTLNKKIPSVSNNVTINGQTCTAFNATIKGQSNLVNPQYCLYDSMNVLVSCNTTGVFTGINYGSYCITVKNDPTCYDTTITRCISLAAGSMTFNMSASPSCSTIGATTISVNVTSGSPNYSFSLYTPGGSLLQSGTSSSSYTFNSVPDVPSPQQYKMIVMDQCGRKDSGFVTTVPSKVNRAITINPHCPSSTSPSGYSDVIIDITDHNLFGATISSKIIKQNGVSVTINPSQIAGYVYTYLNLNPATYIFDTYIQDCNNHLYDTVTVIPYVYPNLSGSQAYQCDNSSFTVSASTTNGVGPYLYEIFGSLPDSPVIVAPPQASSVFNINNGTSYSLIRLRVVDGCGNASLTDVSVLPLANFIVYPDTKECFDEELTLFVDSIDNATYQWYKRVDPNDSVLVGTSPTYSIQSLTLQDTGRYFCKVLVNSGCLIKYATYIITGYCNTVLPLDLKLNGARRTDGNELSWKNIFDNSLSFTLQRSTNSGTAFRDINTLDRSSASLSLHLDKSPPPGNNFYRLKIVDKDKSTRYSNIVLLKSTKFNMSFYPNPVDNILYISISNNILKDYQVEVIDPTGKIVSSKLYKKILNTVISFPREYGMKAGIYFVTVTDAITKEKETFKILFN
ncbi:MAG: T9SS type A sorting domain-containing protein [Ginsengibacter sp.]